MTQLSFMIREVLAASGIGHHAEPGDDEFEFKVPSSELRPGYELGRLLSRLDRCSLPLMPGGPVEFFETMPDVVAWETYSDNDRGACLFLTASEFVVRVRGRYKGGG